MRITPDSWPTNAAEAVPLIRKGPLEINIYDGIFLNAACNAQKVLMVGMVDEVHSAVKVLLRAERSDILESLEDYCRCAV